MGFSFTGGEVQIEALLLSIVNLQLYTVPLLGMLLVYDAIIGERESAMFDVHLTRGVGLVSFLLGKWIGLMISLWVALMPSIGVQAWSLLNFGAELQLLIWCVVYTLLLSGAMVSLGLFLSSISLNRGTIVSLCIGVWLVLTIFLDFAVLWMLDLTDGDAPEWIVQLFVNINPLGLYRLLSYETFFPHELKVPLTDSGEIMWVVLMLLGWIVAPLVIAWCGLRKRYRPIISMESPHDET